MGFYDEIAKDIPWEIASNTDMYLKVKGGKLQVPNPKWLSYNLKFLDKVLEACKAFRLGLLRGEEYDLGQINVEIIRDPAIAIEQVKELAKNYRRFAVDIETSNLWVCKKKNKLLSIGFAYSPIDAIVFLKECFTEEFTQILRDFLGNKDFCFILQNGLFDRSRAKILRDIDIRVDEDTLLMHYCGINEHRGTHGLKELAQFYLGFPEWEKDLDDWKRQYCRRNKILLKNFEYEYFDSEDLAYYNGIDCCATFQLADVFPKLMRPNSIPIYRQLCRASNHYADIISRGIKLDLVYWEELKEKFEIEIEEHLSKFDNEYVSISSPKQLKEWLQARFPNEFIEGTGREIIEELAKKYPDDDLLTSLLEYRKTAKYLKTYVNGLWARKTAEDIIHCEYKFHGTETGRLSSSNPNMQNIPRKSLIKNLFVPREGYTFVQLDYSQLELRMLAHISGDEMLTQVFIDGHDLHAEMAKKIFGDAFDPKDKEQRTIAKTVNFGIPYGQTHMGLANNLKIDKASAKRYVEDWFKAAPKVREYMDKCVAMATADVQDVWYTEFGRARHYFITSENIWGVKNQSINFPISSTASDLGLHALCEISEWLQEEGIDAYVVNTVHDSIILEARHDVVQKVAKKAKEVMESIPKRYLKNLRVPIRADVEIGDKWGEMKEPEAESFWQEDVGDEDISD